MPPMRQVTNHPNVFAFPQRAVRSCITIKTRVIHSQSAVRRTLAHDLIAMGVGHGYVRRTSTTEVDVMVVLPSLADIDLYDIAMYFAVKWNVVDEDYSVEQNNYTSTDYLTRGIRIYKSTIPDVEGRSLDGDIDLISVDGYSVISDTH